MVSLGVTLDRHVVLSHHTSNVCRAVYFHIHLHHIGASLTEDMAIAAAVSMVDSRLDYTLTLSFMVKQALKRLQSIQHSVARVVLKNSLNLSPREL